MFSPLERFVAFRYLRAKRQEGFISVVAWFSLLGIMLGVATLIIVMAVMNGFRAELLGRVIGLNGHVTVSGYTASVPNFDSIADKVRGVDGVMHVTPMVEGQVMASARRGAGGALVRGLRAEDFAARDVLANALFQGSIEPFAAGEGVFIGIRMANRLGLTVGDKIKLISPKGNVTAFGSVPRVRSFEVVGIFNVGMYEYDNTYVYMPLDLAQAFFKTGKDMVSALEIMLDNADTARQRAAEIREVLGGEFRSLAWQRVNASFFNALQVERNVMFLILTLIILVAAFNVISSQIMLVKDKGRGIAILRTMGASRATILRIFFITGSSVGVLGTALGAGLGIAFALNIESIRQAIQALSGTDLFAAEIYFLSRLPAKIDPMEVLSVVIMALTLSLLASIYPAWRAARLDPVEVLRYE